jgi:carboxyl-terminal processing protease
LKVTVENKGKTTLHQLRATTKSDNRLFSERELVFGTVAPGERKTWTTTLGFCKTDEETKQRSCKLPETLRERADGVRVVFEEAHGHAPEPVEIRTQVQAMESPQFAYTVHVADDVRGNGDGEVQVGEIASVYMRLRNVGKGTSKETVGNLRNLSGPGILLHAGRFQLQELKPGQETMVSFQFEVLPEFDQSEAKLEASAVDELLREGAGEKLTIPIGRAAAIAVTPAPGMAVARSGAPVLERPQAGAKLIAQVDGGALSLPVQARVGEYSRVDLGQNRPGWIHERDLRGGSGKNGKLTDVLAHMPPRLEVDYHNTLITREPMLRVSGWATDDSLVRDLYIFVGSHKVFYQSNRNGSAPNKVSFDTSIALRPGINYVTVVAREDNEIMSRKTFIVRRDAPDGSLLETPKENELDFLEFIEGEQQ